MRIFSAEPLGILRNLASICMSMSFSWSWSVMGRFAKQTKRNLPKNQWVSPAPYLRDSGAGWLHAQGSDKLVKEKAWDKPKITPSPKSKHPLSLSGALSVLAVEASRWQQLTLTKLQSNQIIPKNKAHILKREIRQ